MLGFLIRPAEKLFDLRIMRASAYNRRRLADLSPAMKSTIERASPFTMTPLERLASLCLAVEHVNANKVSGAFVECGVWRGGSSMAAALTYLQVGRGDVDLFLFDTFEGMTPPTDEDIYSVTGEKAGDLLAANKRTADIWAYAPLQDVQRNMRSTGYPADRIHFVQGPVEETVPGKAPDQIAILRLDTDWYESTRHELIHLFPRLSHNGILIIDDYGEFAGARKAVDEYFTDQGMRPFLHRIDVGARVYLKP